MTTRRWIHREDSPPLVTARRLTITDAGSFTLQTRAYSHYGNLETSATGSWDMRGESRWLTATDSDDVALGVGMAMEAVEDDIGYLRLGPHRFTPDPRTVEGHKETELGTLQQRLTLDDDAGTFELTRQGSGNAPSDVLRGRYTQFATTITLTPGGQPPIVLTVTGDGLRAEDGDVFAPSSTRA